MKKNHLLTLAVLCIGIIAANAQYKTLVNFAGGNGQYPYGSLIISGTTLYGMTTGGGANSDGCIFSVDSNGSSYTILHSFTGLYSSAPDGSLTLSGTKLYGMTGAGGANLDGNIFSINTNGTGYADLLDFNGANGNGPC